MTELDSTPVIRTRMGRRERENFIALVEWNTCGNEIAEKFPSAWTKNSVNGYAPLKGITSGGKEEEVASSKGWMDRPTDPAWQLRETSSRGSRVCTHRERNTKWSGKHRLQCFLLPFVLFFFPLFFPSPRYFVEFCSNRTLQVMSRGLLNTPRLRSPRPFLSPLERKSWNVGRNGWRRGEGWRENWWLLLLEYKYEYTRECIISRKCSRHGR